MNFTKSKADLIYEDLSKRPDKADAMIDFLRKEAHALIVFKLILDQCVDDDSYKSRLHLLHNSANNIRRNKLLLVKKQIGFWEPNKKEYFKLFLEELKQHR